MNKTKKVIIFLIILSFLVLPVILMADNIDSTYKYSWGENIGWMNWKPSYGGTDYGVTVYNECLTGYIWAENVGWIKLGDTSCAGGDCCQTGTTKGYENDSNSADNDGDGVADDWGVNNDGAGNLSGYAWGENIGWINFKPNYDGSDHPVVINSSGEFTNYAWGENIGWINMNCSNTNYCVTVNFKVKTSWSAISIPTVTTQAVSAITATTATGNGNITSTGGENCDKRGFVYGTTSQADPGNVAPASSGYTSSVEATGSFGTGAFTNTLTGLTAGATYYVRAYAHNSAGYDYGDSEVSFIANNPPTITSVSIKIESGICKIEGSTTVCKSGQTITFESVASDPDAGDTIKLYVCKAGDCANCLPGTTTNCWAVTGTGVATNPSATYNSSTSAACAGTPPCEYCSSCVYYAKVCDNHNICSTIVGGS